MELDSQMIERLAEAAYEIYCDGLRTRGETNAAFVPYAELPKHLKEQNRDNVRDIANKLAQIGYAISPALGNSPTFDISISDLEELAEIEHHRWVTTKIKDGWRYAPQTDQTQKLHNALLPWRKLTDPDRKHQFSPLEMAAMGSDELSDAEKEKDRDMVRGIPQILARAGYTIVKIDREKPT